MEDDLFKCLPSPGFVFIMPVLGGFVSDSYVERYKTTVIAGVIYIAGQQQVLSAYSVRIQSSFVGTRLIKLKPIGAPLEEGPSEKYRWIPERFGFMNN